MNQNDASAPFLRQTRAERLIATGRVVLSVFSLLAVWLDPTEPSRFASIAYSLLAAYMVYSLVVLVLAFRSYALLLELRLPSHVVDLAVAILVSFFTEGPTSPFFLYFVFAMLSAAVRWGWTGTLWTAAVSLTAYLGFGYFFSEVLHDPGFELNRFILRAVYLGVVASLIGYLGIFDERLRREVSRLGIWPHTPADGREPMREALERVAGILGFSQLLMIWEDEEEPWQYLALWNAGRCEWLREPAGTYEPPVAEALAEASFLCADAGAASPRVICTSPEGRLRRLREPPLHPALQARFQIRPVLSWRLRGESFQGRLFALEEPVRGLDRLLLGEVLAWQAAAHVDQSRLLKRLRDAAALEERVRLARDLHDGVIQSLTVAALRLEAFPRLLEADPEAAREEVRRLQELLASEQQELRSLVHELKPTGAGPLRTAGLAARLDELRERIESNWGLRMELEGNFRDAVLPEAVARQVHRLVHEAVVNAARHAAAEAVHVAIEVERRQVRIEVADDGHGFPFAGEYDLHTLLASGLGPASLRDRIASLGGSLHLSSTQRGSELEMVVPMTARET
ncbi:MAG: sensor histidine kinase [Thermoanaerobaculia bacterium]